MFLMDVGASHWLTRNPMGAGPTRLETGGVLFHSALARRDDYNSTRNLEKAHATRQKSWRQGSQREVGCRKPLTGGTMAVSATIVPGCCFGETVLTGGPKPLLRRTPNATVAAILKEIFRKNHQTCFLPLF